MVETTEHIILECSFYEELRLVFIQPFVNELNNLSNGKQIARLLNSNSKLVLLGVAKFLFLALKKQSLILESTELSV